MMAARRKLAWLSHRSRLVARWESGGGHRWEVIKTHLFAAADLVSQHRRTLEASKLQEESQRRAGSRTSGRVKHISEAILLVVARLLGPPVQSETDAASVSQIPNSHMAVFYNLYRDSQPLRGGGPTSKALAASLSTKRLAWGSKASV